MIPQPPVGVNFLALVWIVAGGVAQSAPVPTPGLCPILSLPTRTAVQSSNFLALIVGSPFISWQKAPTQLFAQPQQDSEFFLLLRRVG